MKWINKLFLIFFMVIMCNSALVGMQPIEELQKQVASHQQTIEHLSALLMATHTSTEQKNRDLIKLVLEGFINPNITLQSYNALATAIDLYDIKSILRLLVHGTNPNLLLTPGTISFDNLIDLNQKIPTDKKQSLKFLLRSPRQQFAQSLNFNLFPEAQALLNAHPELIGNIDNSGRTVLHSVAFAARKELIKFLLERGFNIDAQDIFGKTPLIHLLESQYLEQKIEALKTLLSFGPNINLNYRFIPSINPGQPPLTILIQPALHYAIKEPELLSLLIQHGADVNLKDNHGQTILMKLLTKKSSTDLLRSLKIILDAHPDINTQDEDGDTALHIAAIENAEKNNTKLVLYLLHRPDVKAAINLNLKNNMGDTPLITLLHSHHISETWFSKNTLTLVKEFLKFPFNINAQNNEGDTALYYAVMRTNSEIGLEIIKLLKQAGADSTIKNDDGEDALDIINLIHDKTLEAAAKKILEP